MEKRKEVNISGNLKIKRKRFWADRYAEIQNNVFFYFKSKGIPKVFPEGFDHFLRGYQCPWGHPTEGFGRPGKV